MPFADLFDGFLFCGQNVAAAQQVIPGVIVAPADELFTYIDFYFPVNSDVWPGLCAASWIPDFQHRFLPELFSASELAWRDAQFARIAAEARLVVLKSLAVEDDFRRFYPNSPAKTRVLRYSVDPPEEWLSPDPIEIQAKYNLPDKFVLCSNQFWQHKNHTVLFQAIALLKQAGLSIPLVCTGPTLDYRCPDYYRQLQNYIGELGIADQIHILGMIPRIDQIQLLRRCLLAVQPSLFEGLSLMVCETRALGKPILLSDLAVHAEHEYGVLFDRYSPSDLAVKMVSMLAIASPGPDCAQELAVKAEAASRVRRFGRCFCELALEARSLFNLDHFLQRK
jgi:glycosyltransferase involved in cell wall biosynthesis